MFSSLMYHACPSLFLISSLSGILNLFPPIANPCTYVFFSCCPCFIYNSFYFVHTQLNVIVKIKPCLPSYYLFNLFFFFFFYWPCTGCLFEKETYLFWLHLFKYLLTNEKWLQSLSPYCTSQYNLKSPNAATIFLRPHFLSLAGTSNPKGEKPPVFQDVSTPLIVQIISRKRPPDSWHLHLALASSCQRNISRRT